MRVLCAIPCLDEEIAIGSIVLRAARHVDAVLVVDDGSKDRTAEVAEMAGAEVIRHHDNQGKGAGYATFWEYAVNNGYDVVVTLDGDGQHNPDEIPLLLDRLAQGYDVVIGARWGESTQMPWWRKIGKRVLDYTTAVASGGAGDGPNLTDSQSGFRAYGATALAALHPGSDGFTVESQILIDAHHEGLKIGETRIHCRYDVDGSSMGSFRHASGVLKDLLFEVGIHHPLVYIGIPSLLLFMAGIGSGLWSAILYQTDPRLRPELLFLTLMLSLLGSLGLFAALVFNLTPRIVSRELHRAFKRWGSSQK